MKYIGAHVSIAGGVENAPLNAEKIGANAFAMFTKNQRQWKAKPLEKQNITAFAENLAACGISPDHVLPHDGYLINLGNPDPDKRKKSQNAFLDEAQRVEQLGLHLLNFHPGSHLREINEEDCMALIAEGVRQAIKSTNEVVFVFEGTAGQGSNLGYTFEQLASMIDKVGIPERTGVCLDTCHMFAAGYDIRDNYENTMEHFERVLGFDLLYGMHLNDAKSKLGQKLDRHDSLGKGNLGWDVFENLMRDTRLDGIPLILETVDDALWAEEISLLRKMAEIPDK